MEQENEIYQSNNCKVNCLQTIKQGKERIWCVAWHPSGDYFATGGSDLTIRIWGKQAESDKNYIQMQTIDDIHPKSIRSLAFSPDGEMLASGSFDSQIGVYKLDPETRQYEFINKLEGHDSEIKSVNWSKDSQFLISCSRDKTVWVWDKDEDLDFSCYSVLDGHSQDVKMVKFVPNSFDMVSCSFDDTIRYWEQDDEEWSTKGVLSEHSSIVWGVDFDSEGNVMASVSEDQSVKIWKKNEDQSSKFPYLLDQNINKVHERPVYSCSFNQDGIFLATAGGDNSIAIFQQSFEGDKKYQLSVKQEQAHGQDINGVAFSPSQDILVSVGDDKCIKIWEITPNL